jgi:hypothetical protein
MTIVPAAWIAQRTPDASGPAIPISGGLTLRTVFIACVVLAGVGPVSADEYPHLYLKNDKLKVKVYLPDAQKGFYRGTRFDWAGVFGEVEFAGHKLFGPWKDTHDPTNHDDIIGPCEEFGMEKPLGYDDAKVGETFLKIGVGELEKPKEEKYSFAGKYKIVKPAEWKVMRDGDEISWATAANAAGFGYKYQKEVRLLLGEPVVEIRHTLQNTGTKPIVTDFYNHNFFNVDGDPIGPNYRILFSFEPKAKELRGRWGELADLSGRELGFKKPLTDGFVMAGLEGFDPMSDRHQFHFRHAPSGVRLKVTGDYRLAKMNVWGINTTICPEPFMNMDLRPGKTADWTITYRFEHDPPKK